MSNVVFKLGGETARPVPKQPAFTLEGSYRQYNSLSTSSGTTVTRSEDGLVLD